MEPSATITITLVFALGPRQATECVLTIARGCTLAQALQSSSVLRALPVQQLDTLQPSVWGRKVAFSQALKNLDRIELCRPLSVDPKVARRERFVRQGSKSAGLFASRRPGAKAGY